MRAGEEASDKGPGMRGGYKGSGRDMFLSVVDNMLVGWRRRAGGKAIVVRGSPVAGIR